MLICSVLCTRSDCHGRGKGESETLVAALCNLGTLVCLIYGSLSSGSPPCVIGFDQMMHFMRANSNRDLHCVSLHADRPLAMKMALSVGSLPRDIAYVLAHFSFLGCVFLSQS